jgi:hypothetical protein
LGNEAEEVDLPAEAEVGRDVPHVRQVALV